MGNSHNQNNNFQISNTALSIFIEELTKVEINYKEIDTGTKVENQNSIYCTFSYNGYYDYHEYMGYLMDLLENTKEEIIENYFHLLEEDLKASYREYLNLRLRQFEANLEIGDLHTLSVREINGEPQEYIDFEYLRAEYSLTKNTSNFIKITVPQEGVTIENSGHESHESKIYDCHKLKYEYVYSLNSYLEESNILTNEMITAFSYQRKNKQPMQLAEKSMPSKLKWTGTPAEFGAIFNMIIDRGHIPIIKDKKTTVRLLYGLFEIKNDQGETTNFEYLYKCFGERIRNYSPKDLNIPHSDNSNK